MTLVTVWLLGRPYKGITHDATLYLAQGLRQLSPAAFSGDIFFAFGSQDAFSAFSLIYAQAIAACGPAFAAMLLTVLGQITFILATWLLVRTLMVGVSRWWALVLLASLSGYYGGLGIFRLAEPFGTARSLAEPLAIASLAALMSSRWSAATVLLALAAVMHPLVAIPALAVAIVYAMTQRDSGSLASSIKIAMAATLIIIGTSTVSGEATYFDFLWRTAVKDRSPHLFLLGWEAPDWSRIIWGATVAILAREYLSTEGRRLVAASVAVCLAGLAGSLLAVDVLDSASFAALQMWRAHWLLTLLAVLLIPVLVSGSWQSGNAGKTAAGCIIASCCFARPELPASAFLAIVAAFLLYRERHCPGWFPEWLLKPALVLTACVAATGTLFDIQLRQPLAYGPIQPEEWTGLFAMVGAQGVLILMATCIFLLAKSRLVALTTVAALMLFIPSVVAWDSRSEWTRALETAADDGHPFRAHVREGDEVFWPAASTPAWVVLHTRSWFTGDQGAGIVFHRETAMSYENRRTASLPLRQSIDNCSLSSDPACKVDLVRARALCERADHPDFLALAGQIDATPLSRWPMPGYLGFGPGWINLHACRDLLRSQNIH